MRFIPVWMVLEIHSWTNAEKQQQVLHDQQHCLTLSLSSEDYCDTGLPFSRVLSRTSGDVRVQFRVRFQVPIFGGFPVENPTNNRENRVRGFLEGFALVHLSSSPTSE